MVYIHVYMLHIYTHTYVVQVKADKENEVKNGHDGTWVAHPALVLIAKDIFDAGMKTANQISKSRSDVNVTAADLLAVPDVRLPVPVMP